MKRENLTRQEAMKAAVDGKRVRHWQMPNGAHLVLRKDMARLDYVFKVVSCEYGEQKAGTALFPVDGYYIIEPEPKVKEVVMYAPVFCKWYGSNNYFINKQLFEKPEHAARVSDSVGYKEEKVFLKEQE